MGITTFSKRGSSSITTTTTHGGKWGGPSDFSRPSFTCPSPSSTKTEPTVEISQPRFSVFGKKASINKPAQEEQPVHMTTSLPRRAKFELHLSTKSAANNKQQEQDEITTTAVNNKSKKRRQDVTFDPLFLEQVCLFRESTSPIDLEEAHHKKPCFRLLCPNWPTPTLQRQKNMLLYKKSFFVTSDNLHIKGKLMIRNLALDKSVSIRYTFDRWTTVTDVDGIFFGPNPKNIAFDIYEFAMDLIGFGQLKDHGELRGKIEFAIRFTAGEKDYWDNNHGQNYQIKVICDPLNDPWANERKEEGGLEEEDTYSDDDEEEEDEKHNSFTNALKGYKHAKPFHLNKRQPWLGTRYDFGQSLQLAKRAPYESWSTTVKTDPDYFLVKKPVTEPPPPTKSFHSLMISAPSYSKPMYIVAPPSPQTSPFASITMPPPTSSPLDINSSYYLDLVNKYCFYEPSSSSSEDYTVTTTTL